MAEFEMMDKNSFCPHDLINAAQNLVSSISGLTSPVIISQYGYYELSNAYNKHYVAFLNFFKIKLVTKHIF